MKTYLRRDLPVHAGALQAKVVDVRPVGDRDRVGAGLQRLHRLAGLLERDREARADRADELRQGSTGGSGDRDAPCRRRPPGTCETESSSSFQRVSLLGEDRGDVRVIEMETGLEMDRAHRRARLRRRPRRLGAGGRLRVLRGARRHGSLRPARAGRGPCPVLRGARPGHRTARWDGPDPAHGRRPRPQLGAPGRALRGHDRRAAGVEIGAEALGETVYWLPEHAALVLGDIILGRDGGLRLPRRGSARNASTRRRRCSGRCSTLCSRRRVPVTNSESPVLEGGRAALQRALAR